MGWIAYIGTYTSNGESKGVYAALWQENGELGTVRCVAETENPSYLTTSPDGRSLYAVLETDLFEGQQSGGVASYTIDENGGLTQTGVQPSLGTYPCYLSTDPEGRFLFVANYGSGTFASNGSSDATMVVFPIENGVVGPALQTTNHAGHGAHPVRQRCPHAHYIDFAPDGHLCAVDFGMDVIFTYAVTPAGALYEVWQTREFPGCGPRHMAFLPEKDAAYVVNELNNDVTLLRVGGQGGFTPEEFYPTLPADFEGENLPAAIKLSPDHRMLVVSNRGHDSIAVYRIGADGVLDDPSFTPCGGKDPRDLAFSPDGRFLYAANQTSHTITAFSVRNGALEPMGTVAQVESPVCLRFVHLSDEH